MNHTEDAEMLPGFNPAATARNDSGLRDAALATISALADAGLLDGKHAVLAQLLTATAERAGAGLQAVKTTIATTNLIRLLLDILDRLPSGDEAIADAATQFLAQIAAADAEAKAGR